MSPVKRRFPGAESAISAMEAIRVGDQNQDTPPAPVAYLPAPAASPAPDPTAAAPQPATPSPQTPTPPAVSAPVQPAAEPPAKKATTIPMRVELKKRAETAVKVTKEIPGRYNSFTAFVEGAIEHELARLADELNGGVPFEANTGAPLTTGRPAKNPA